MDHAAIGPLLHFFGHDFSRVVLGIASVDDDRQTGFSCRMNMSPETLPLALPVTVIIIIIQSGFADGNHPRMFRLLDQLAPVHVGMGIGFMRMDPDARPHVPFPLGSRDNIAPFAFSGGDIEHRADAAFPRALQNCVLILDQTFIVQMTVAIDQHIRLPYPRSAIRAGEKFRRAAATQALVRVASPDVRNPVHLPIAKADQAFCHSFRALPSAA